MPFELKGDMPTCNQEINIFQFESKFILELEVNPNHNPTFIKWNIYKGKLLLLTNISPILIIIILREIIIVMTTFAIMNSLTLDSPK